MVNPIPEGFRTVTPYIVINDAAKLLSFLSAAFGAKEMSSHKLPNGRVMHAQVKIGDSMVMLADAPEGQPSMPCMIYLYVPDTDAVYKTALAAGGISLMEPGDQFYGDRNAGVKDPCGNQWWIATHKEDMSDEELLKRALAHKK